MEKQIVTVHLDAEGTIDAMFGLAQQKNNWSDEEADKKFEEIFNDATKSMEGIKDGDRDEYRSLMKSYSTVVTDEQGNMWLSLPICNLTKIFAKYGV